MRKALSLMVSLIMFATNIVQAQKFTSDYIALTTPREYAGEIYYVNEDKTVSIALVDSLKHDKSMLPSFSNLVSNVTTYELNNYGELKVLGIGLSAKSKDYLVIYDFSQSQTLLGDDLTSYESILVGVSIRMVAKIKTRKAGINISSPFGLVANTGKIEGSLEVRVSGAASQKINDIIPTTSDLSASSIATALQSVATIKSHIYDNETVITPKILAYSLPDENVSKQTLTNKINPQ